MTNADGSLVDGVTDVKSTLPEEESTGSEEILDHRVVRKNIEHQRNKEMELAIKAKLVQGYKNQKEYENFVQTRLVGFSKTRKQFRYNDS